MIKWRVQEVAKQRGIKSAVQLAEHLGVAPGTAVSLWYGRSLRIDLPTLARVCKKLNCTPNDVLVFEDQLSETRTPSLVAP